MGVGNRRLQDSLGDGLVGESGCHGGIVHDVGYVAGDVAVGELGQTVGIDVGVGTSLEVQHEHLAACLLVGQGHVHLFVDAARTKHSRVYLVRTVGCSHDENAALRTIVQL